MEWVKEVDFKLSRFVFRSLELRNILRSTS